MKLRVWLKKHGEVTGEQFAERSGVPQPTISRFVSGVGMPGARNLAKIVAATRGAVSVSDLLEEFAENKLAREARERGEAQP